MPNKTQVQTLSTNAYGLNMCIAYDTNTLRYKFYSTHAIFCSQTVKPLTCPCLYSILLYKFAGYKSRTILQRNGEMLKAWRDPQEMFS
jgi:hypothetical protein